MVRPAARAGKGDAARVHYNLERNSWFEQQ